MKQLLIIATILVSGSVFAQDSVDFILADAYGSGRDKPLVFARVSVSKRIYDLTKANPKIELVCKYSKDKELQLGMSKGQIYATHKSYYNGVVNYCDTTSACSARIFADLSDWRSMAVVSPKLTGDQVNNYSIRSTNSWLKTRDEYTNAGVQNWKYAELDNIETLEIYSPSKHKKTLPTVNGFSCSFLDYETRKILEP